MQDPKKGRKVIFTWKRTVAGVLVIAMVAVTGMSAMVDVSIHTEGVEDTARNILIEQTPYIQRSKIERILDKFSLLKKANDYEEYYDQACIQIAEEKYDQALKNLDKCLDYLEGDAKETDGDLVVENRTDLLSDVLIKKGCILQLTGDNAGAKETLTKALGIVTDDDLLMEVYAILAQISLQDQAYEEAETNYQKLLKLSKSDADVSAYLYMYGIVLVQLEKYDEALEILDRAIAVDDETEGCYYYRGVSRMMTEQYKEAIEDFTESIARSGFVQQSYYSRAVSRLSLDATEYTEPAKDLQAVIDYKGSDADETIRSQAEDLLEVLEEAGRREMLNETESES